jgi:hypothetical protein
MGTISPIFITTHWPFWTGKRLALRTDDLDTPTEQTQDGADAQPDPLDSCARAVDPLGAEERRLRMPLRQPLREILLQAATQ